MALGYKPVSEHSSVAVDIRMGGTRGRLCNPETVTVFPAAREQSRVATSGGWGGLSLLSGYLHLIRSRLDEDDGALAWAAVSDEDLRSLSAAVDQIAAGLRYPKSRRTRIFDKVKDSGESVTERRLLDDLSGLARAACAGQIHLDGVDEFRHDVRPFAERTGVLFYGARPHLDLSDDARRGLRGLRQILWGARMRHASVIVASEGNFAPMLTESRAPRAQDVVGHLLLDAPRKKLRKRAQRLAGKQRPFDSDGSDQVKRAFRRFDKARRALSEALNADAISLAELLRPHLRLPGEPSGLPIVEKQVVRYMRDWEGTDAALVWHVRDELDRRIWWRGIAQERLDPEIQRNEWSSHVLVAFDEIPSAQAWWRSA